MKNSTLLLKRFNSRFAWKVLTLMLLPLLQVLSLQAQGLKISNVNLNASGNVNIVLKDGGFTNNGTFTGGGESLKFKGTSAAEIGGGGTITLNSLTVDNTAGLTLGTNLTVTGTLDFQNGKIATGPNLLTMGPAGTITNAASSKYVEGRLAQTFSDLATKIFPIGKGGNYRPLSLRFTLLNNTGVVTAEQFETAISGDLPEDVTLTTTDRHWSLTQEGATEMKYYVTLDPTGYTPDRPVVILKKDGGIISAFESTTPNYTNQSFFGSFSYFALGEECVNPDDGGQIADNQTVCEGESPDLITNESYPSGFTGTLEYKWQISYDNALSGFNDIADTDTDEYAPASVTSTCWLKRVARVDCKTNWDGAAESNVVQITVNPGPLGGTLAGSASVCYGTNSTLLTLSGYENEIVRWEYTETDWSTIVPVTHTTDTYTAENLVTTTQFRVVVRKGDCDLVYSDTATITVYDDFDPGAILTTGENIWIGDDAAEIGSSSAASGGDESITYQWQSSLTETFDVPVDLSSGNTATYDPGTLDTTTWFRRLAHDGLCNTSFTESSGVWKVTVNDPVFEDDLLNKSLTWQDALTQATDFDADDITLLKDYTQTSDANIGIDLYLDLYGNTFGGGKVNTIADDKSFGFFNSLSEGTFDNEIHFSNANSTLVIFDKFTPGPLFTTANSANPGMVRFGNGNDPWRFNLTTDNESLFSGAHRFDVSNKDTLGLNGGLASSAGICLYYRGTVKLGAGNFPQNFTTLTTNSPNSVIQVGDSTAATCNISGDFSNYSGNVWFFNGSTLNMNMATGSENSFSMILEGSTASTKAVKKGGAYTIGNPSANDNMLLKPYGVLDLSDTANHGTLSIRGNIRIQNYDSPNSGYIRFRIFDDAGTITTHGVNCLFGTIVTDEPSLNEVDVSRHFVFDFDSLTATPGQTYHIEIATISGSINLTGTPVPLNAPGWENFTVNLNSSGKGFGTSVYLHATYNPCINPVDPGTIEFDYSICLGEDPYEMYGSAPSGYNGTLEYKWQNSLVDPDDPGFEETDFTDLFDTDTDTYLPSSVSQTTWFRRGAKVECDTNWVYSNIIEVTVNLPSRRYVTMNGAGFMDGLDWENAYDSTMLQDAINESCVNEVWVAEGTYLPTQMVGDEGDKYFAFQLANGVAVYGGFAGTEDTLSQRSIKDHPTILSGDINQDDDYSVKPWDNTSDNVYHVFHLENGLDLDSTAILDGFIIQGGYSLNDVKANIGSGGGIYIDNNSPYISNCEIRNNYAQIGGGGVYLKGESNQTNIVNCLIYNNISEIYGGGVYAGYHTSPTLTNNTIISNFSEISGGGIYAFSTWIEVNNCLIWDNTATSSGNQIYFRPFGGKAPGTFTLNYSCYSNGTGDIDDSYDAIVYNNCITSDPLMVDPVNGDYRIYGISPCADAGNNNFNSEPYDIRGSGFERILNKGFTKDPSAFIDMGAYEYKDGSDPKAPCTNTANGGEIGNDVTVCQDSIPSEIQNITLPTGHSGDLEFRWEMSTTSESSGFTVISGANDTTYQPGALTDTTWFRRIVRVDCKPDWSGADTSNVVKITMEPTPVAGTLTRIPDADKVCEGTDVSASLAAGSGGSGTDHTQFRTHDGTEWSTWTDYALLASVTTTAKTGVEIRTWRAGTQCSNSDSTLVSWIIEQTPVSGTLAKTPEAEYVCEGDKVSAELTEGTGGNGTDSLSYRTHNGTLWSSWQAYTSETEISTTGMDTVEIQTLRKADYCSDADVVKESWKIEQTPVSGTLAKTPDADYVCEGDKVSAKLTAGTGGNGTDSLSYRTHNGTLWSSWQAYTSETEISTTGMDTVVILTIRKADYCSDATAVTERWIIEQTPFSGTLTKTPDENLICQGDKVSASLNPGSGGNGTDSLAYRTFNGIVWSSWQSYIAGSDISTDNITRLEIQTLRLAVACTFADADTVRWAADLTPPVVTPKTNVSVTLDPTGNYTLLATDLLQSWTDAGVGIQSVSIEPETVSCSDLGSKNVLVTVSDNCDNQTEVNITITVLDNTDLGDWESCNTHISAYGTSVYSPCNATGNFKLTSKGKSTSTSDVMHFVYKPLTGNGTIIARLDDVKSDGYAGVMMRESCAPGSKVVLFKTRLYNPNVLVGYRKYTNKTIYNMSQVYQLLRWMKIQRNGNTFQVFVSYNGTTWLRSYSTTIEMSSTILAGIFTENYLTNRTTEAWFDHVELYNSLKLGNEFAGDENPDPETEKPDVLIYPNPATDELTITLMGVGELSGYKASLFSSEGRLVQTFVIREINTLLDVSALQPGIYTLRIEDHENVLIRRLVIQ